MINVIVCVGFEGGRIVWVVTLSSSVSVLRVIELLVVINCIVCVSFEGD